MSAPMTQQEWDTYHANLNKLGIGTGSTILSPTMGSMADWADFPSVVNAYAGSFPHNGPLNRRTQDWGAQVSPSRNPNTKRPRGPGESVIMS